MTKVVEMRRFPMKKTKENDEVKDEVKDEVIDKVEIKTADKAKQVCSKVINKLTTNTSVKNLVIKSVIYMLIPYAYIFVCGFIFDMVLKWYFMTTFIFISMCILWMIAIALIIISIIKYRKRAK